MITAMKTKSTTTPTSSALRCLTVVVALIASACASSEPPPASNADTTLNEEVAESDPVETAEASDVSSVDDSSSEEIDAESELDVATEDDPSDGEEATAESIFFPELCSAEPVVAGSRVDIQSSGNRIAPGSLNFADIDEFEVELPDAAVWVTADPSVTGGWYVVLERGSAVRVSADGVVTSANGPAATPPELDAEGNPQSPFRFHELFADPIDDGRVIFADSIAAVLSAPTGFYAHGVLGDALEAAAIEWVDTCTGETGRIDIAEPDVIEGIAPILADIDRDGQMEIVVTLSNSDGGARLAAFELDGTTAGESDPIGQGNRWRNPLAVGAFGPEGEIEIIDVRTPHIGGTVQAFRQIIDPETGPTLAQVAASGPSYTSHVIDTRNLSMGVAVDLDADNFPDVLVATADLRTISALTRTSDVDAVLPGWNIIGERELTNGLTSNIATQEPSAGRSAVAIGDGNILRIWN